MEIDLVPCTLHATLHVPNTQQALITFHFAHIVIKRDQFTVLFNIQRL